MGSKAPILKLSVITGGGDIFRLLLNRLSRVDISPHLTQIGTVVQRKCS